MATVAPSADQSAEILQKLSLEPSKNTSDLPEAVKKGPGNQFKSKKGGEVPNAAAFPQSGGSVPPMEYYFPNGYPHYYYGGYDGEGYSAYPSPDAAAWEFYSHGYGYLPFSPYFPPSLQSPGTLHDGQFYGPQYCQPPTSYFQHSAPSKVPNLVKQNPTSKAVSTSAAEKTSLSGEMAKADSDCINKVNSNGYIGSTKPKPGQQNSSIISNGPKIAKGFPYGGLSSSGYQDPRFGFDAMRSPVAWNGGSQFPDAQKRPSAVNSATSKATHDAPAVNNSNLHHPHSQHLGMYATQPGLGTVPPGIMNIMNPNSGISYQTSSSFRNNFGFGSNYYDSRMNGLWSALSDNKFRARGRSNSHYNYLNDKPDGLGELNRGPRADPEIKQKAIVLSVIHAVNAQSLPTVDTVKDCTVMPDIEQYNKADFPETYADAKFFIIKSYSEDNVHKSIKYNVWASTLNGHKKLDLAYQESQHKTSRCPVFLFFSVNASGQFIGVAEMVGPVDFDKTVEHWQQDKWTGCFPVKWHIVKDVPNGVLKHITLENNDNKPVTNSRDTQEVKLELGLQMIKIFKEHVSQTSILDDFSFYDNREKLMQEKRAKLPQVQKKNMDAKPLDVEEREKNRVHWKPKSELPVEAATVLKKEALPTCIAEKLTAAIAVLSSKVPNSVSEKIAESNGGASGV